MKVLNQSYASVPENTWPLTEDVDANRRAEILEEVTPLSLISRLAERVEQAAATQSKQRCVAHYEEQTSDKIFQRSCVFIAIDDPPLFNQIFNGRCGYRAMYYHSPDLGLGYNQLLVNMIVDRLNLKNVASLTSSTAKMWPFFELTYETGQLSIDRWQGKMGSRIFCSKCPAIILKGGFLNAEGIEKDFKPHSSQQLHDEGFS